MGQIKQLILVKRGENDIVLGWDLNGNVWALDTMNLVWRLARFESPPVNTSQPPSNNPFGLPPSEN